MGAGMGAGVGSDEGRGVVGTAVGFGTGTAVGLPGLTDGSGVEGCGVGRDVGFADGRGVGCGVGLAVGSGRGTEVGICDIEGAHVSSRVGLGVVGASVGWSVGDSVRRHTVPL